MHRINVALVVLASFIAAATSTPVVARRSGNNGELTNSEAAALLVRYPELHRQLAQLYSQFQQSMQRPSNRVAMRRRMLSPEPVVDYDDFEEAPPMAAMSYVPVEGLKPKGGKRYRESSIDFSICSKGF